VPGGRSSLRRKGQAAHHFRVLCSIRHGRPDEVEAPLRELESGAVHIREARLLHRVAHHCHVVGVVARELVEAAQAEEDVLKAVPRVLLRQPGSARLTSCCWAGQQPGTTGWWTREIRSRREAAEGLAAMQELGGTCWGLARGLALTSVYALCRTSVWLNQLCACAT
jgi:hypothetical protein